ncbi:MAG: hypothetical protein WD738_18280 [Pirellulales bacterium]
MKRRRGAFTLFELILAIALSAALLALIGTAINLYLLRVDASRTRVEEAQLARSILAMIADDIRATSIYKPQDTSAIAELIARSASDDDDSNDSGDSGNDEGRDESGDGSSADSAGGATGSIGGSGSSPGNASSGSSPMSGDGEEFDGTMPLGLSGTLNELYLDVTRLPRREELFSTVTGYTNAPLPMQTGSMSPGVTAALPAGAVLPSDLKTVRYFFRQGEQVDPASVADFSNAPSPNSSPARGGASAAGGLVRQEIPRRMRVFAEQSGNSALLEEGQVLIAPEVVHLEFRYYNGQQVTDVWDMQEEQSLPMAIEVRIWLASADSSETADAPQFDRANLISTAREYRQTVYLPMSELVNFGSGGGGGEDGEDSSSSSSSSSSGSTSGTGFSQP